MWEDASHVTSVGGDAERELLRSRRYADNRRLISTRQRRSSV